MPLVLTRKVGEKVVIDGDIIITVKEIRGQKCQLLFTAPDEVEILRGELLNGKQRVESPVPCCSGKTSADDRRSEECRCQNQRPD